MEKKYDVLIVGTGLGGLYTALSLPENLSVLMLSKKEDTLCNSSLAQGGVAAVLSQAILKMGRRQRAAQSNFCRVRNRRTKSAVDK